MSSLGAALRKDLLLGWRSRAQIGAVFVFGATAFLLFSFAIGPSANQLRQNAAGFLWIGILLASTLSLSESFRAETEQHALEGLLLLPADARALYYAKALSNGAQLLVLGIALLPVLVVLYDVPPSALPHLVGILALGCAGLSAPGTLYAGMAAQLRAQALLLPLLLFPLVVPVLLAATKATGLVLLGDPMGEVRSWSYLLLAFDGIYWSLSGLLFGFVVEE